MHMMHGPQSSDEGRVQTATPGAKEWRLNLSPRWPAWSSVDQQHAANGFGPEYPSPSTLRFLDVCAVCIIIIISQQVSGQGRYGPLVRRCGNINDDEEERIGPILVSVVLRWKFGSIASRWSRHKV